MNKARLKKSVIAAILAATGASVGGATIARGPQWQKAPAPETKAAGYVGSQTCGGCHESEWKRWRASQHRHAMAEATDNAVVGNFDNTNFDYHGIQSRFFRKGSKFFVETDGPNGKLEVFQIKYTFGLYPLQQYLIEFPDGRIQALSIAWDARPEEQGGQRWFHLYPTESIRSDDALHWTKLYQNWNFMCSECHSSDVHKNYDAAANRFSTTWREISVGCEACHGPGSRHIAWARSDGFKDRGNNDPAKGLVVVFDERRGVSWGADPRNHFPQRSRPPVLLRKEVETCGRCHARRSELSENWIPGRWLSDTHEVSLLNRMSFYADGQMHNSEETYNYAPFKQSKMFAKGVTCSDCHDPHSGALRIAGSGVCLQCHAADKYQAATHSRHNVKSADCISCHMPVRRYMVVDRRHDHSFRVPRPDLSVKLGTPNACNNCHRNRSAQWAANAIKRWFGPRREGFQHYAEAFRAAWAGRPNAAQLLAEVASNEATSAWVRASAFSDLKAYAANISAKLARVGLSDPDPMVRVGALDMLEGIPVNRLWSLASPLLSDPIRGVRIKAASVLASTATAALPAADRERFEHAAGEFVAAQWLNADRPEARTALGTFYAKRGRIIEAENEYRAALGLSPQFAPAAVNLADLYRVLGRDKDGADVLRRALAVLPRDAGVHYALGLALVRMKQNVEALAELRKAAELAPDQPRYAYAYAVGLNALGRSSDAIAVLKQTLARHPWDRETLVALILFYRDAGNVDAALAYAERLAQYFPTDSGVRRLIQELKAKKD